MEGERKREREREREREGDTPPSLASFQRTVDKRADESAF
jgi:hypothetical protein